MDQLVISEWQGWAFEELEMLAGILHVIPRYARGPLSTVLEATSIMYKELPDDSRVQD
ncbi:MAG: hypothetical protein ACRD8O_08075 [Bryobacteraceae bacterium]